MNDSTLGYLMECASYAHPVIQRSLFAEREGVDFDFLLKEGFLVENGRLAGSVMVYGMPVKVHRDRFTDQHYYWDCGEREAVRPETLLEYDLRFDPLARLLGRTYRCDAEPEMLVDNALWYLGVPEAGCAEVYLARNIGTDARIQANVGKLTEEMTVLWMGRRPDRKATNAALFRLKDFLVWKDGLIEHRPRWPDRIPQSAVWVQRTHENALIFRGDKWELWCRGKGPINLDNTNGCFYIARILQAQGRRLSPLEVAPPENPPEERAIDNDNRDDNDFERPLENYTVEQLAEIRNDLKAVKARESAARDRGDTEEAARLKEEYDNGRAIYNKATRPGGRSTLTADQMSNVKKRIRVARNGICAKLEAFGGVFQELAEAWKNDIKVGNECYYAPVLPTVWQVHMG